MKSQRLYLFPHVIELSLAARRSFGVNIYLIDGGNEFVILDIGLEDTLDEVIDLIRAMDFPLSRCKMLIAGHAHADHVQGLAAARERLKTKVAAHPNTAELLEAGDTIQTMAHIAAQKFDMPMPACKVDTKLKDGSTIKVGELQLKVWSTPGHTPGQICIKLNNLLFVGDNVYKDGCVGVIDAHHGSSLPHYIESLTRIRDDDSEYLLPSHGPAFKKDVKRLQATIDRLTKYQEMADFGTCAVRWPLQEQWENDILAGTLPEL